MGKKSHTSNTIPSPNPRTSAADLSALIDSTSLFFDDLVKLIPPKFYLPGPDADDRPWFQGLSKPAKFSLKKQSRENLKLARRLRFNPQNPSSTLDLLNQSIAKPTDNDDDEDDDDNDDDHRQIPKIHEESLTYEELQLRLKRKLEELRSGINTRPKNQPRVRNGERDRKRKREFEEKSAAQEKKKVEKVEKDEGLTDLTFSKVKIGDEKKRKKKKISKEQELEKAKRLEELKKDPETGQIFAKKHSWKAAESRAMGEKVHDDPKLLKESIKKEKKRQKKHVEKWKERVESRDNVRKEKQAKRTENIRERIREKKQRRIEKREKKLMRPGFEGRKEGYIN